MSSTSGTEQRGHLVVDLLLTVDSLLLEVVLDLVVLVRRVEADGARGTRWPRRRRTVSARAPFPARLGQPMGSCTDRALDGMHPTLRHVPPGGPRLSMQSVYSRSETDEQRQGQKGEVSFVDNLKAGLRPSDATRAEGRRTLRPSWDALTAATYPPGPRSVAWG